LNTGKSCPRAHYFSLRKIDLSDGSLSDIKIFKKKSVNNPHPMKTDNAAMTFITEDKNVFRG